MATAIGAVKFKMGRKIFNKLMPADCQMTISESLYQRVKTIKIATKTEAVNKIGR